MGLTLRAIDSVPTDEGFVPGWTFGGGTSLAIDLEHRISYDIDAFMDSARTIQRLVPVINPVTRSICWNPATQQADYQYPGHYLKLIVGDVGEIDFLAASPLTAAATKPFDFDGRLIARERPAEVIAKKLYYRGSNFKTRDVFDLAGTFLVQPDELREAASSPFMTPEVYARARLRMELRAGSFIADIRQEVNPTEFGRSYLDRALEIAVVALDFMEKHARPAV